ncbi:precorrin-3B C(17)-methyltransferase [Trinickia sp. LjRoot230]|uniref:precorrin-3B C(17)-methyltransferase n=1 Tax=Trinickia sp. LjRoot230 TaxID=3342288 RepID=UPI003ECC7DA3
MTPPPAIVVLGASALPVARRVQASLPGAQVHTLRGRATAERTYDELGAHLRELYACGTPIIALCAAGIVIRCLATMLANKGTEPPVLALAEDGSAVVPLLGGLTGANAMAREIGEVLGTTPAITTSGELRFGTCLLNPPDGYTLASLAQGKRFVSDLLAGASTRIEGNAPWLDGVCLPLDTSAPHAIRVTPYASVSDQCADELVFHPRSIVVAIGNDAAPSANSILEAMGEHRLAPLSLAALLVSAHRMGEPLLEDAAACLHVPLRFVADAANSQSPSNRIFAADELLAAALHVDHHLFAHRSGIAFGVACAPIDTTALGQRRGRLSVVGLGPGCAELMVPAARTALDEATDILGYDTYVKMAGPFGDHQRVHASDNREEMQRARHAFELASAGRTVVIVSSGDPGVFAMAAAVLEALDEADDARWAKVELRIVPGVSAAMATAAQAGAPLGHDFCILSLSDNLKPWSIIEDRLRLTAAADLVIALYNPIARARPWQLARALDVVRGIRTPQTPVVLGRDIGRPGAALVATTLGELRVDEVDMRTTVIIGSSTTRSVRGAALREWIYTPRSYPER